MITSIQERNVPPLRALRTASGLGLRETARRAQIDASHLGRIERGMDGLSISTLYRLARVLGPVQLAEMLEPYVNKEAAQNDRRRPAEA